MFIYVLDINSKPLMPTQRCGKVRRLLKSGKAKVVRRCPFTVQLLYETATHETQPIEAGDDTGSKHNGLSAVALYPNDREVEVYRAELLLRNDIVGNLANRRQFRQTRRNRKTRYRQPRFNNRVHSKNKGWLAPSVQAKIDEQLQELRFIAKILPVTKITAEVASFDLQKLKADLHGLKQPHGEDYQHGEQESFWNCREYVLFRDGHTCQCCKGRSKDKILNVHHIESRKTGGDAPNNLVTLCETCHKAYHAGKIKLPDKIKRQASMKDATFMGIMRWAFYEKTKAEFSAKGIKIQLTYGYKTKNARIQHKLEKSHCIDALCISGHPKTEQLDYYYLKKKVRCHNRQIHKATIVKGGYRKLNQAAYEVKGFRLYDKVRYGGQECFIFGRRTTGQMDLRFLDGTHVNPSVSYKKLKLLKRRSTILVESRAI